MCLEKAERVILYHRTLTQEKRVSGTTGTLRFCSGLSAPSSYSSSHLVSCPTMSHHVPLCLLSHHASCPTVSPVPPCLFLGILFLFCWSTSLTTSSRSAWLTDLLVSSRNGQHAGLLSPSLIGNLAGSRILDPIISPGNSENIFCDFLESTRSQMPTLFCSLQVNLSALSSPSCG